jgi:hypothetical protein
MEIKLCRGKYRGRREKTEE